MVQRFYIDTSIVGGVFDTEFEEHSTILFEKIKLGSIKAVISEVTLDELSKAHKEVRDFLKTLTPACIEYVALNADAVQLADAYI